MDYETAMASDSPLLQHAAREMKLAGLFDEDADYGGTIAPHVLDLVSVFKDGGHTGFSAPLTVELFSKLASFQALTPLTSNPDEWTDVRASTGFPFWQNNRDSRYFSYNGGKTWYTVEGDDGNSGSRDRDEEDAGAEHRSESEELA